MKTPQQIAEAVREAVAKVCESLADVNSDYRGGYALSNCAHQIRSLDLSTILQGVEESKAKSVEHIKTWQQRVNESGKRECMQLAVDCMEAEIAELRSALSQVPQAEPSTAVREELRKIGELIRTQDNRITDQPLFIVQQKRSYVTDADYNDCRYEWRETESGEYIEATPERAKRLDAIYRKTMTEPKGWKRYAMFDVWEFVTACFTEKGCKDYLAINGHNLREPRIYAEGSFRNHEYQAVRNWLKSIAAAPAQVLAAEQKAQPLSAFRLPDGGVVSRCEGRVRSGWELTRGGHLIRYLNMFEVQFIDSAIAAAQSIISPAQSEQDKVALLKEARSRIASALPEDEPDCVPDWVCELLINLGAGK